MRGRLAAGRRRADADDEAQAQADRREVRRRDRGDVLGADGVTRRPWRPPRPAPEHEHGLNRAISRNMLLFFVLGDVLGAGIYALVGEVGGRSGGAIWTAFAVALLLAVFTAFAYAELVTKYPQAAGAALYVNKAFRLPFVTFMVAFAVMASGITSAARCRAPSAATTSRSSSTSRRCWPRSCSSSSWRPSTSAASASRSSSTSR